MLTNHNDYIYCTETELPDTLQFADISVLSNTKCNDLVDPIIPKTQICTYDFDNKKQPCNVSINILMSYETAHLV